MQCVPLAGELKRPRHIEIATASLVLLLTPAWSLKVLIRTIFVAAAALASVIFSPGHAKGAQAPWCALIDMAQVTSIGTASLARSKTAPAEAIFWQAIEFCTPVAGSQRQAWERHARPYYYDRATALRLV
jgi:hypothetical protein